MRDANSTVENDLLLSLGEITMQSEAPSAMDDPILHGLIHEAVDDPETVGLLLSGSRAASMATPTSDYDLYWILSDAEYDRRRVPGVPLRARREPPNQAPIDLVYVCQRDLDRLPTAPGWWTYGYATARVLVDKTGEVTRAIEAIATMTEEKARADVVGWFDAYANALVRSVEAGRRSNELGARLHAGDSAGHLMRVLFALERRWTPYHDRLMPRLPELAGQGWPEGYLQETLLGILMTADAERQLELAARVEALLRARGFGGAVDGWADQIGQLRAETG
jgi:hypothetical protein